MTSFVLDVKLTADGKQLVAEVRNAAGSVEGLTQSVKGNTPEAERLRNEYQRGAAGMSQYTSATDTLSTAVKALAGSYMVLKVLDYARDAAMLSARYETLGVSMTVVGNNAGYTSAEMEAAAVGMQKTGISMVESRQQALRLVQAHIDLADSSKLARIAQDAAVIGNMNSSEAFATMIHGIQTGQTDVLRTIGLNISMEQSYKKYADTLGKSAGELTQTEKTQAMLNAVMKEGEGFAGTYEAAMGTAGKQLNSMTRYVEDLKVKMGGAFLETFTQSVFGQNEALKKLGAEMDKLTASGDVERWGHQMAESVGAGTNAVKDAVVYLYQHRAAIEAVGGAYASWKIAAWTGPIITQSAAAAAATVEYYSAVAAGSAVELGSARAAAQRAAAQMAARSSALAGAEAEVLRTGAIMAEATAQRAMAAEVALYGAQRAAIERELSAAALGHAAAVRAQAAAETVATAATAAHAEAMAAAAVSGRAATAANGLLAGAVTALGGPIGVVITALGVAATAWAVFGSSGEKAIEDMLPTINDVEERILRLQNKLKFGSGDTGRVAQELSTVLAAQERWLAATDDDKTASYYQGLVKIENALIREGAALEEVARKGKAANVSMSEFDAVIAELDRALYGSGDLEEGASAYNKIKKSTDDYITSLEKETAAIGKNVYERKYLEASAKMLTAATRGQRDEIMRSFSAWSLATQAADEQKGASDELTAALRRADDVWKANIKTADDFLKAQQDITVGLNKEAESLREKADAAELELAQMGMTKEQLAGLTARRYDEQIAIKMAAAALLEGKTGREADLALIEQQIDALHRLKNAAGQHAVLQQQADDLKRLADDWKRFTDDIDRALTDALMRGFENGESFGQNFIESLRNSLKTAGLKIFVQAITSPVMGSLGNVLGGASGAAGQGFFGDSQSIGSTLSAGGSLYNFATGNVAGGAYGAFAASTLGQTLGLSQLTAVASTTAAVGTQVATTLTGIGQALPYLGAALLAAQVLGIGQHGAPAVLTASAGVGYDASGDQTYMRGAVQTAETDSILTGIQAAYAKAVSDLGMSLAATEFWYSSDTGRGGQNPNLQLGAAVGGQQYLTLTDATPANMQLAASQAILTALQASEMPDYLHHVFDGLVPSGMTQAQINDTMAYAQTLKVVRDMMSETRTPMEIMRQKLLDGTAALHTSAETFRTDLVAAIDAGISPETLEQWWQLGAVIEATAADVAAEAAARKVLTDMTSASVTVQQSLWQTWNTQTDSVRGLIQVYDGSRAATDALASSIQTRYAIEQQLVDQISASMSSLSGMFASSAESMRLSVMDQYQKSNYYVDQANDLEAKLRAAVDPAAIEDLARRLNDAENNAWANLDETQRRAMLDSYTKNFDEINTLVQEKLGRSLEDITKTSATDLPAQIKAAISDAMKEAAGEQKEAAAAQQSAAASQTAAAAAMQAAASTPITVGVDVRVDTPATVHVGVL